MGAWLGHANISTTSRYLKTTRVGLQRNLKRFEEYQKRRAEEEKEFLKSRAAEKEDKSRIRTPFAQTPAEDTPAGSLESARNSANLLN